MKKIIITLFLVLALGAGTVVFAGTFDGLPEDIAKTLQLANQEIHQKYGYTEYYASYNVNGLPVNEDLLRARALIVYGSPHDLDPATEHHRYLGETLAGEKYTNTLFRHDPNPTPGLINDWNWIPNPWNSGEVEKSLKDRGEPSLEENKFNGNPEFNDSIIRGLESYQQGEGAAINFVSDDTPWHTYVHVLQPPTDYTWGMGRMWHKRSDGAIRYLTVPMAPLKEGPVPDLDLAVTFLDPGVPVGEKAQPGQQYTGTVVVENLSGVTMSKPAAVKVTHQGYEATSRDKAGNVVNSLTLLPGESETITFTWHGPTDTNSSTIKATINLPPDAALPETNLTNNEKTVAIPINLQNLSVQITGVTGEAYEGNPVTVKAVVNNDSGEMLKTKLVWKVNGNVFKTINDFDIIKHQDIFITFDMPGKDTVVSVEVNPEKNKPSNELNWADNIDQSTITLLEMQEESEDSRLEVTITPELDFIPNNMTAVKFTVTVRAYVPEPPPGSFCDPRTVALKVDAQGQIATKYNHDTGDQNPYTHVINETKTFTAYCGRWTEKTYSFTIPSAGLYGQEQYIPITAVATMSGRTARDTAKIRVAAVPIPGYELQLTR